MNIIKRMLTLIRSKMFFTPVSDPAGISSCVKEANRLRGEHQALNRSGTCRHPNRLHRQFLPRNRKDP